MDDRVIRHRLDALTSGVSRSVRRLRCGHAGRLVKVYDGGAIPASVPAFFLTHPVELAGGEEEGDVPTQTEDAEETIPVYVLGPEVPAVGTLLSAHATGGRWVAWHGGAAAETDECYFSCSTPLPRYTMALSWLGTGSAPPFDAAYLGPMTLEDPDSPVWMSDCLEGDIRFRFRCSGGSIQLHKLDYPDADCGGTPTETEITGGGATSNPFVFTATDAADGVDIEIAGPTWWPDVGVGGCTECGIDCVGTCPDTLQKSGTYTDSAGTIALPYGAIDGTLYESLPFTTTYATLSGGCYNVTTAGTRRYMATWECVDGEIVPTRRVNATAVDLTGASNCLGGTLSGWYWRASSTYSAAGTGTISDLDCEGGASGSIDWDSVGNGLTDPPLSGTFSLPKVGVMPNACCDFGGVPLRDLTLSFVSNGTCTEPVSSPITLAYTPVEEEGADPVPAWSYDEFQNYTCPGFSAPFNFSLGCTEWFRFSVPNVIYRLVSFSADPFHMHWHSDTAFITDVYLD